MPTRRPIDERDIDELLASLTDRQIADLFGGSEAEIAAIRRQRRSVRSDTPTNPGKPGSSDKSGAQSD
jgi:hypothetical protein